MLVVYEVEFAAVIRYEMHEWAFRDMTTLSFPYLIQRLCDETGVPEILDVDRIIEVMSIAHNSMIKDLANPILP